jgi:hypothetical protein
MSVALVICPTASTPELHGDEDEHCAGRLTAVGAAATLIVVEPGMACAPVKLAVTDPASRYEPTEYPGRTKKPMVVD